jgi:hypothetical protein
VLLLITSFAVATLATGLTNATLPSFLEDTQGLSSGGYGFGIAALATGLLLGEALVGFSRVGATAGVFGFASAFVSATMTGAFAVGPVVGELADASGVIMGAGLCLLAASVIALVATVQLATSRVAAPAAG